MRRAAIPAVLLSCLLVAAAAAGQAPPMRWEHLALPDDLADAEVRSLWVDPDGGLWLGTRGAGLAHLRDGEWTLHGRADGLPSDSVTDVLRDGRGRLWAATAVPGALAVLVDGRWQAHAPPDGWDTRVVFNLSEDPEGGGLWVAATGFAARWREGRWSRPLTVDDGLPHEVVHDVHVDRFGTIWLACRQGLARHLDGETVALYADYNFRSLLPTPDGRLWMGTAANGILVWDEMTWTHHLAGVGAHPVLVDRDGGVWAKTDGAGLYRRVGEDWAHVTAADGLPGDVVHDIAEGPDGSVWVATDGGVARLVPGAPADPSAAGG